MKIYNTLSRQKEEFVPIKPGKVGIYVCGPTVYNYIHVGNARPMVVFDTLRRYFLYKGYDVTFVSNFTDVDDKIIHKAMEEKVDFREISKKYIAAYLENSLALNFDEDDTIHPRATEYISEMISFIEGLIEKEAAYVIDGNVYFDITKAKDYGKLSGKNIEDLRAGARIDVSEEKKNPMDFALWKKRKVEGEPAWESPWGMGRPGWHLECSVMSKSILGETIDIHAGGEDLQFPHHENEIAQSETLSCHTFANYWMHNSMIMVDNEKMSKSKGNFFLLKDIAAEYDLEIVRMWLLSVHYRNPINFSKEVMEQTKAGLGRLYNGKHYIERLLHSTSGNLRTDEKEAYDRYDVLVQEFENAMDDDLNTAIGLTVLYEIVKHSNIALNENSSHELVQKAKNTLDVISDTLGLLSREEKKNIPAEILDLVEERKIAKKEKNFARADAIRDQILEKGWSVKDTREGVVIEKL